MAKRPAKPVSARFASVGRETGHVGEALISLSFCFLGDVRCQGRNGGASRRGTHPTEGEMVLPWNLIEPSNELSKCDIAAGKCRCISIQRRTRSVILCRDEDR